MASATSTVRIKDRYNSELAAALQKELGLANPNEVPALEKIVVSVGLGKKKEDKRMFEVAANTLRKITGQEPVETIARKSIAGFKLREGQRIGMMVTLRGDRMYEFLDRVIAIVLPRLRDFHGVSNTAFDPQGNYSLGLVEQSVFPELSFEETTTAHGLQITIVTTAKDKQGGHALLTALGMPFKKNARKSGE